MAANEQDILNSPRSTIILKINERNSILGAGADSASGPIEIGEGGKVTKHTLKIGHRENLTPTQAADILSQGIGYPKTIA